MSIELKRLINIYDKSIKKYYLPEIEGKRNIEFSESFYKFDIYTLASLFPHEDFLSEDISYNIRMKIMDIFDYIYEQDKTILRENEKALISSIYGFLCFDQQIPFYYQLTKFLEYNDIYKVYLIGRDVCLTQFYNNKKIYSEVLGISSDTNINKKYNLTIGEYCNKIREYIFTLEDFKVPFYKVNYKYISKKVLNDPAFKDKYIFSLDPSFIEFLNKIYEDSLDGPILILDSACVGTQPLFLKILISKLHKDIDLKNIHTGIYATYLDTTENYLRNIHSYIGDSDTFGAYKNIFEAVEKPIEPYLELNKPVTVLGNFLYSFNIKEKLKEKCEEDSYSSYMLKKISYFYIGINASILAHKRDEKEYGLDYIIKFF